MRNLRIALLAVGTIISLFSLRDNGMVTTAPDTKPLVAEAYHSPQDTRLPPLITGAVPLVVPPPSVRTQPQVLTGSPSVDSLEYDSLSQNRDAGTNEPVNLANANTASPAPIGKPATNSDLPSASPPTAIIYGMASIDSPSSANDNNAGGGSGGESSISGSGISSNNGSSAGGASPSSQSNTNNVSITNLAPNSGIPGTNIIIQGAGFDSAAPNNIVKFGSISAASVGYVSKNQLRATIPQGLSSGFTNLSVSVRGAASNSFLFDILKDVSGNVFIDDTQNILPAGMTLTDSSIIRSGDLDNDSDLDLLVVDKSSGTVYLLINDGQGNFADETSSRLPAIVNPPFINDAVFGDLNKDGYPDILLAYSSGQSIRLLLNDGQGKFNDLTGASLPAISGNAVSIDLGDYNGDGMPDVIVANSDVRDILLVNDGTAVFAIDTNFDLPGVIDGSSDIRFCDLNGDGSLDIITTNNDVVGASSLRNRVYTNDGQGQFTDATESILPDDNEYSEVLDYGDIDNDGNIDVIVANDNQNAVLINKGSGIFEDQTTDRIPTNDFASKDTKLGDMNGDGYLDIVMLGNDKTSLLINDGQGSFKEDSLKLPDYKSVPATLGGKNIQVVDINGDGSLDIIIGGESLHILMSTASNKAPVLAHIGNRIVARGENLTFNVSAEDPNGDELTLLAENLPGGATFLSKMFSWVSSANDIGQPKNVRFIARENTQAALEDSETITITVTGSGLPVIDYHVPDELDLDLILGQIVQFGIHATDPDGRTLTFKWFLNGAEIPSSSGATSSIIFIVPRIGGNTVEAKVSNSFGTATLQWNLTVGTTQNQPPSITSYSPNQSVVNIDLLAGGGFSFGVTATDPELDTLSYTWKFNNVALPESGANLSSSAFVNPLLVAGDYPLEVSVSDGHNATVTHSWTIHVTQGSINRAPTAVNDSTSTTINASTDIDVLSNDSDLDGNALTVSAPSLTQPSHGMTVIVGNKIRYTPAQDYTGSDSFTYKATDGLLESGIATVTVTIEQSASDQLVRRLFNYFWNETDNPETGFTRDRLPVDAANRNSDYDSRYNMASMAATGFGLSAMCVAAEKYGDGSDPDWQITKDQIRARVELIMDSLLEIQGKQDPNDESTLAKWGKDGFFYHFVNIETGERWTDASNRSEVSTIDTAIVVAGLLTAGEYFGADIKDKALQIYRNVNWNAFLDKNLTVPNHHVGANLNYNQMYHAWNPDRPAADRFYGHWDYTNECLLLYLLAAVSPESGHEIPPETFYAIRKELGSYGANGNPMVKSWFGSLFVYQYTQAFFNFKDVAGQPLYDKEGVDWWKNSVEAVKANKQFCNDNIANYAGQEDLWGLTSGYTSGFNYEVYGAPPAGVEIPSVDVRGADGTVHPSAVSGSIPMLPEECIRALDKMKELYDIYGYQIWGDYGFVSSFKMGADLNETPSPISSFYCAIDMGISLVMAENHDSGLIWNNFSGFEIEQGKTLKDAIIQRVGFTSDNRCVISVDDPDPESDFHMGQINAANPTYTIQFNLDGVDAGPYLLAIHSFMAKDIGDHTISGTIKVNDAAAAPIAFEYNAAANPASSMKYVQIDPSDLKVGDNTIMLQWQSATGNAKWLAWKNIEVSSPIVNSIWAVARNETANPPALFGSEYRLDDTYYAGAHVNTFEQALNKDVEAFTDILFYNEGTEYAALTIGVLETQGQLRNSLQIFVNGLQAPVFNGQVSEGEQLVTPGFYLEMGWNRITIYHPGIASAPSEWVRWDSMALTATEPPVISAPEGFAAASFGKTAAKLRWNSAPFAAKYNLYRSMTKGGPYTIVDEVNPPAVSYTDTGLLDNTVYYYVVRAVKADSAESQDSQEAAVTTGSYQLDYGDGHSPNVFGQGTFDNAGSSLGDNAFTQIARYNGLPGKVRIFNVASSQKNTIGLNNANINDATIFSFRVKGETGGEKFQIKLKDNAGAEALVSLEIPSGAIWQEMHFNMADTFSGIDLTNMQSMEVVSQTIGRQITFYFDEVEFATVGLTGDKLDVKIRNGANDGLATGVDFGATTAENGTVLSNQYIEIGYASSGSWGIQIFTDNKAEDARPRFTGTGDRANGLVGMTDSGYRVPVLWQVWQEKKGYYNGTETPEFDTTDNDGDRAEFAFIVDKSDSDWSVPFAQNYRTLIDHDGLLGAPVPLAVPPPGYWPRLGNTGQPIYVYLAANFTGAPAQQYTTNRLIIDIYHG